MVRPILLSAALAGCAAGGAPTGTDSPATLGLLVQPPVIISAVPEDAARASVEADKVVDAARPERRIEGSAAAFLYGSPVGRRFLASAGPGRALARGEPPATCAGAGVGADPAGRRAAAARAALEACHAELAARDAPPACGCRLLALDDTLLAPLADFALAPGISARLIGAGGTAGRPLVAEERAAEDDDEALIVTLRDAGGPIAEARLGEDGRATLTLASGERFEGRREPRGWRRGRLAERLLLTGARGEKVIALIGFEPADIAADSATLARWPG